MKNISFTKSRAMKRSSHTARARAALIFSLSAIVLVSALPPTAVNASQAKSWVISSLIVQPDGNLKVCEGEVVEFEVWISRNEGTWTQIPYINGRFTFPPASFQASSSNINAGYITPGSTSTSLRPNSMYNIGSFSFKAKKKGTATIKFHDNGGSDRPPASDQTVNIEVAECDYKLVIWSNWLAPEPFLTPSLYSILSAELAADQNGDFLPLTVEVENTGHHTQGMPFCSHPLIPEDSHATIEGHRDLNNNSLDLVVKYDPLSAETKYICTVGPIGSFTVPNQGPGQALNIDKHNILINTNLGMSGMNVTHEAKVVNTVVGYSVIIISPIYLP